MWLVCFAAYALHKITGIKKPRNPAIATLIFEVKGSLNYCQSARTVPSGFHNSLPSTLPQSRRVRPAHQLWQDRVTGLVQNAGARGAPYKITLASSILRRPDHACGLHKRSLVRFDVRTQARERASEQFFAIRRNHSCLIACEDFEQFDQPLCLPFRPT